MAISINWATKVITIPQADLTPVDVITYQLDLNWFRLQLKDIEDDVEGMPFLDTHLHVPPLSFGSVTLARVVQMINGYTVTFQDVGSPYAVELVGANTNVNNVTNINNVSVRANNTAGLVYVETGTSGLTPAESALLTQAATLAAELESGYSAARILRIIAAAVAGKVSGSPTAPVFRNLPDTADQITGTADLNGNRTSATYGS